jgi:hypothetical protein
MKSQISRDSFRPEAGYSGVYLQQGRMILDADWNESTDIQKTRLVEALRDAIGGGAPRTGGLALGFAGGKVRITPGALYVGGVPARLDMAPGSATGTAITVPEQPDYPLPKSVKDAYSDAGRRFYADVWERTVTAVEQDALRDPGLHGADTATRSQTLLQVKWCERTRNPLSDNQNPAVGNARLSLALRNIVSDGDACNPCAIQVNVDERIGNYLFRVEVHDYDATTGWLTLKWSRDNGAEACAADAIPTGFDQGDWVWEFYDRDTERLLGNHLHRTQDWVADYLKDADPAATAFITQPVKFRGLLRTVAALPPVSAAIASAVPAGFLRQWDGYLRINLASKAMGGIDRGVALTQGDIGDDDEKLHKHGRVLLGDDLHINLERMALTLTVKDRRFVAGDYWQAEVREARHGSGDVILAAAAPRGIRHRYLYLGELDGTTLRTGDLDSAGTLVPNSADAARRRMQFPMLSDLRADDVSYAIPSKGSLVDCVRSRLPSTLGLPDGQRIPVQAALDNLHRELDAGTIPYAVTGFGGQAKSIADMTVRKTGDTMTGALTITPAPPIANTDTTPALAVTGLATVDKLKLSADSTVPDKALLSLDKATGLAKWLETDLTAWQLANGNLQTSSGVTGAVTIGPPETECLHVAANGRVGIGTKDPQAPLHIVTRTSTIADSPHYGMKWVWGQHIADGATKMWGLDNAYGRLITWDSDSLFVGLKDAGSNRKDAVIAWGDDRDDALLFLHAPSGSPPAAPQEVMRLTSDGIVEVGGSEGAIVSGGKDRGALFGQNLALQAGEEIGSRTDGPFSGVHAKDGTLSLHASAGGFADPGGDAARLFIDAQGHVGIGTTRTSKARLVVEGDVYVTGRIIQKGQAMALASREIHDIVPSGTSQETSLGGTSFALDREAEIEFAIAAIGVTTNATSLRISLRLHSASNTQGQELIAGGVPVTNPMLTKTTRVLPPGHYALEVLYSGASSNTGVIKTLSVIVTESATKADGETSITVPSF